MVPERLGRCTTVLQPTTAQDWKKRATSAHNYQGLSPEKTWLLDFVTPFWFSPKSWGRQSYSDFCNLYGIVSQTTEASETPNGPSSPQSRRPPWGHLLQPLHTKPKSSALLCMAATCRKLSSWLKKSLLYLDVSKQVSPTVYQKQL